MVLSGFKWFWAKDAKDFKLHLAFFWSLFLSAGFYSGVLSAPGLADNMFYLSSGRVYLVTLFFLCSVSIVTLIFRYRRRLALLVASLHAFGFGFVFGICAGCFGRAGWLVSLLLNFTGILGSTTGVWFWSTDLTQLDRCELIGFVLLLFGLILIAAIFELLFLTSVWSELLINFN